MKRRAFIKTVAGLLVPSWCLLLLSLACAFGQFPPLRQAVRQAIPVMVTSSSVNNITADVWETFEFSGAYPTKALLEANDNNASCTWTVVDTNATIALTNVVEAQKTNITTIGGVSDGGTYGLMMTSTGGVSYIRCNIPSAVDNISVRVAIYVPSLSGASSSIYFLKFYDGSGNAAGAIQYAHATTEYRLGFNATTEYVVTPPDTWYWVTFKYVKLGTCSVNVYNSSGTLVGSCTHTDTTNKQAANIRLGVITAAVVFTEAIFYFDNLVVDYTSATFPIVP